MWLSNTPTCLLMLPIVKFIVDTSFAENENNFFKNFNFVYSLFLINWRYGNTDRHNTKCHYDWIFEEKYNIPINFIDWAIFIAPLSIILLIFLGFIFSFKIRNEDKKVNQSSTKKTYFIGNFFSRGKNNITYTFNSHQSMDLKMKINQIFEINLSDSGIALFFVLFYFCNSDK